MKRLLIPVCIRSFHNAPEKIHRKITWRDGGPDESQGLRQVSRHKQIWDGTNRIQHGRACRSVVTTPRVPAEGQIMSEIKMCSVGLEGWKIVSQFNYILFRFCRPARRAVSHSFHSPPTPPSTTTTFLPSRVFYVFPPFQFPLEWKSLEHYCNFPSTANGIGFPLPTALPCRPRNSHLYKMDGFFFPLSSFLSPCEMDAGNCCCRGIYGEAMTVCMCSEAGIAKESTGWQWAERIKVWDHVTRVE